MGQSHGRQSAQTSTCENTKRSASQKEKTSTWLSPTKLWENFLGFEPPKKGLSLAGGLAGVWWLCSGPSGPTTPVSKTPRSEDQSWSSSKHKTAKTIESDNTQLAVGVGAMLLAAAVADNKLR